MVRARRPEDTDASRAGRCPEEEWLTLLADDVRYLVYPLDYRDAPPADALFLVSDDRARLTSRVDQLNGKTTWAENPRSRTRRFLSNFEVESTGDDQIRARANFAVWRFKNDLTDVYVGRYENVLVYENGQLRIRERSVRLDLEALRPHGKLSFIL